MKIVEYNLNGTSVYIEEIGKVKNEDIMAPATSGQVIQKAKNTFDEVINNIKPIAERVINTLNNMEIKPDETSVELALKFSADLGIVLTSLSSEANIKITLKWKK